MDTDSLRTVGCSMDAVYPTAASVSARGRRRRGEARQRHRTMPVTFAEIKEVDEDKEEGEEVQAVSMSSVGTVACAVDELDQRLCREFAEFRRRRVNRDQLRELDKNAAAVPCSPSLLSSRASSEPRPDGGPS